MMVFLVLLSFGVFAAWIRLSIEGLYTWHLRHKMRFLLDAPTSLKKENRVGYVWRYVTGQVQKEQRELERMLPRYLDLLGMTLSAGLNFQNAWAQAAVYLEDGRLKDHVLKAHQQMVWGRSVRSVLEDLATAFHGPVVRSLFFLIIQSRERGSQLSALLHERAAFLRRARQMALRKQAQLAALKLLFPLIFVIFPALFLILFGPLIIQMVHGPGLISF